MFDGFATAIVILVMLMDRCYRHVFLHSVVMFLMLVLRYYWQCLVVVHVGDGLRCMTFGCPEYCRYACFFASSRLNTCMVVIFMLVSCYAMSSVLVVIFMLISMPCSSA
ncbi:hypothetical protein VPH35_009983 [Triticum aestivum]